MNLTVPRTAMDRRAACDKFAAKFFASLRVKPDWCGGSDAARQRAIVANVPARVCDRIEFAARGVAETDYAEGYGTPACVAANLARLPITHESRCAALHRNGDVWTRATMALALDAYTAHLRSLTARNRS